MFRDMGDGTLLELDRMAELTGPWLKQSLADRSYRGWLAADHAGRVIAGGGVLLSSWPASPNDPLLRRAMILNVYTEPEFRQRGLARLVLESILDWLRQQGFHSVSLHASDAAARFMRSSGFGLPTRCGSGSTWANKNRSGNRRSNQLNNPLFSAVEQIKGQLHIIC